MNENNNYGTPISYRVGGARPQQPMAQPTINRPTEQPMVQPQPVQIGRAHV